MELISDFRDHFCAQLDNAQSGIKATIRRLMLVLQHYDKELWHHVEVVHKVGQQCGGAVVWGCVWQRLLRCGGNPLTRGDWMGSPVLRRHARCGCDLALAATCVRIGSPFVHPSQPRRRSSCLSPPPHTHTRRWTRSSTPSAG